MFLQFLIELQPPLKAMHLDGILPNSSKLFHRSPEKLLNKFTERLHGSISTRLQEFFFIIGHDYAVYSVVSRTAYEIALGEKIPHPRHWARSLYCKLMFGVLIKDKINLYALRYRAA